MPAPHPKPAAPRLVLGSIPATLVNLVLAELSSPETRRNYARSIADFVLFAGDRPVELRLLLQWRDELSRKLSSASVNVRLAAVRKLIRKAKRIDLIDDGEAASLLEMRGLPFRGSRAGNWLTQDQTRRLLASPDRKTIRGKRNYCILALLVGCALRRDELARLEVKSIQQREGRWVILNIHSKGGRVRTVAIPSFVVLAIGEWKKASGIESGKLIRQLTLKPEGLSPECIWKIVHKAALGIGIPNIGPHDLRRTCAQLCRAKGERIEHIQAMLGHEELNTTDRYLNSTMDFKNAVNDNMGL